MENKIVTAEIINGEDDTLSVKVTADKISTYDLGLITHALMGAIANKKGCSIAEVALRVAHLEDKQITEIKYCESCTKGCTCRR